MVLLTVCFAYNLLPRLKLVKIDLWIMFQQGESRISATKIICIHNKLIKSQSSHKATHFRGQLFQLPDIFRFFDFLFGGSLAALVLFSFNRNAAFSGADPGFQKGGGGGGWMADHIY